MNIPGWESAFDEATLPAFFTFLQGLPEHLWPLEEEVGCDPDGSINCGWYASKSCFMSCSFSANGLVPTAWRLPDDNGYTTFHVGSIPLEIIDRIHKASASS